MCTVLVEYLLIIHECLAIYCLCLKSKLIIHDSSLQVFVFSIETTWNGDPVNHSPVQLKVSSENKTSVRVDVVGPLFNDPGPPPVTSGSPCPELWEYEG